MLVSADSAILSLEAERVVRGPSALADFLDLESLNTLRLDVFPGTDLGDMRFYFYYQGESGLLSACGALT
jgi:hypothetical protein